MNNDPRSEKSKFFGERYVELMDEWIALVLAVPVWVPPISDPPISNHLDAVDLDLFCDLTGLPRTAPGWIDTRSGLQQWWDEMEALHAILWEIQLLVDTFPVWPETSEMDRNLSLIKRWKPHTHKSVTKFFGDWYLELMDAWYDYRRRLEAITLPFFPDIGTLNKPWLLGDIDTVNGFLDYQDTIQSIWGHIPTPELYWPAWREFQLDYRFELELYWNLFYQWPDVFGMPSTKAMQDEIDKIRRWPYHAGK